VLDETESKYTTETLKRIYANKIKEKTEGDYLPEGLIAESMVQNFFQKLTFDFDVNFQVIPADIHQDIHQKIDFIIRRKSYSRGVGVAEKEAGEIGVQFTTAESWQKIQYKERQLDRARKILREKGGEIDDYVLVSVPLKKTREIYQKWQKNKMPGGPDKLWDQSTKELIFKKVLEGILTKEEIEKQWEIIKRSNENV